MTSRSAFAATTRSERQTNDPFTFSNSDMRALWGDRRARAADSQVRNNNFDFAEKFAGSVEKLMPHMSSFDEAARAAYMGVVINNPMMNPVPMSLLKGTLNGVWIFSNDLEKALKPDAQLQTLTPQHQI